MVTDIPPAAVVEVAPLAEDVEVLDPDEVVDAVELVDVTAAGDAVAGVVDAAELAAAGVVKVTRY